MRDVGPSQLYTCRYWAFGEGCPNHNAEGSGPERNICFYEHRNTGVDAMYQGPINLTGLNLEIANAAAKGGFNTWNQAALYDLIWSVKRVALRHSRSEANRPRPKDPVYPDRFRPSGLGDNSGKKRKLPPTGPRSENPVPLGDFTRPSRRASRPYRYHNRQNVRQVNPRPSGISAGNAGTFEDPIDLSDGENDRYKRQRLNDGGSRSSRPQANQSRLRADAVNFRPSLDQGRTGPLEAGNTRRIVTGGSFTQQDDFVSFTQGDTNSSSITGRRTTSQNIKELIETPLDSLSNALIMVPRNLNEIANLTHNCTEKMKETFDNNKELLSQDEVFPSLVALNANFEAIKGEIKLGMDCLSHVKDSVQRFKREGIEGMS